MNGRRTSGNIDDRRGRGSGRALGIGGGIVGVIIVAAITLFSGGGISDVLGNLMGSGALQPQYAQQDYTPDAEDERLATFASQVLAGTEDVWTREFSRQGWGEYQCPKMVLFSGAVQSGCGQASSQTGPFYCSADQTIYLDLDFFKDMKRSIGADGDFAYAYVIAHEVGHHVQYLLGTLDQAHSQMSRLSEREANRISVRTPISMPAYGPLSTTRCSIPSKQATWRRPSMPPRKSATTICNARLTAARSPIASTTAVANNVCAGSQKASPQAIQTTATPSRRHIQTYELYSRRLPLYAPSPRACCRRARPCVAQPYGRSRHRQPRRAHNRRRMAPPLRGASCRGQRRKGRGRLRPTPVAAKHHLCHPRALFALWQDTAVRKAARRHRHRARSCRCRRPQP